MRSILSSIQKPSHYAGIEEGAVRKDPSSLSLHMALAFPDLYEVGMSYLGQKILYALVNEHAEWWAERVMAPEKETGDILREKGIPLATLESDTPLKDLDLIGFSVTHELCYTNILYMLDLAGIPLRHADRLASGEAYPLVIAGGGAIFSAEPLAPFMDLCVLGDGEAALPPLLRLLEAEKQSGNFSLSVFLEKACHLPGIYVPSFFDRKDGRMVALRGPDRPRRVIVPDLDAVSYPTRQVVPVGAVHNRLSIEIARGCTRGCRFCQAGMVYRPARERSTETIERLVHSALSETGFEEVSFMALSTGDYSALKALSHATLDYLHDKQISLSLPSQRVGSIDDTIIARMADLRRTGMTLAPEAGSQRLRDVINKGITEEELILHAQKLLEHGWRVVKLYFMIGLPFETDEDLLAIRDLCCRVRDAAGKGNPRLQVTAALSPFVPKPFTPFQWAAQCSVEEIGRRVRLVREAFSGMKGLRLRWHEPSVSHLEGIISRAGREMADVVEKAYRKGGIFPSWMEHFSLAPWLEAMEECGLAPADAIGPRDLGEDLPWDHIEVGVDKAFLRREWEKAKKEAVSGDCRYGHCHQCGVCDRKNASSLLRREGEEGIPYQNRLVRSTRDQEAHKAEFDADGRLVLKGEGKKKPALNPALARKICQYRVWHTKMGGTAFVSQLELQTLLERALRRAGIPISFSCGFHPMPLLSFGRALPVGVESLAEWFSISLHEVMDPAEFAGRLTPFLPDGIRILRIESVTKESRTASSIGERFEVRSCEKDFPLLRDVFSACMEQDQLLVSFETKKGTAAIDVRALLKSTWVADGEGGSSLFFETDWHERYLSPVKLLQSIFGREEATKDISIRLLKRAQFFSDAKRSFESDLPWGMVF